MNAPRRLIVGITGATGFMIGVRILDLARSAGFETHLVITTVGQETRGYESELSARDVADRADVTGPPTSPPPSRADRFAPKE